MALRCFPVWVCPQTTHRSPLVGLAEFDANKRRRFWECSSSASQRAVTAIEGEIPYGRELKKSSEEMGLTQETESVTFHRDLSMLPSESSPSPSQFHRSCCFIEMLIGSCVYAIIHFSKL